MLRTLLTLALVICGSGAAAQEDVSDMLDGALRENGCGMTDEEARAHFDAAGVPWSEVLDAVREMSRSGYVLVRPDGGYIGIDPSICHPTPIVLPAHTVEWVLKLAPDCRLPRQTVERVTLSNGSPREMIDPGIAEMLADGRLSEDGPDLILAPAQCAEGEPDEPADAITFEVMHPGTFRGGMYDLARDRNCRLPGPDHEGAAREIAAALPHYLLVFGGVLPEGMAALEARVREVLDDPRGAFATDPETGEFVLVGCGT